MEDKLKLIKLANEFDIKITKGVDTTIYIITLKEPYEDEATEYSYLLKCQLCFNNKNHLISEEYFITGIYNSGSDDALIDIDELNKLRQFVVLLNKED